MDQRQKFSQIQSATKFWLIFSFEMIREKKLLFGGDLSLRPSKPFVYVVAQYYPWFKLNFILFGGVFLKYLKTKEN